MKRNTLFVVLALLVCMAGPLVSFSPARTIVNHSVKNINHALQSKVQPFCKLTFVDHRGHSIKLSTSITHASSKSLTFIFDGGEKLIINFTTIRAGHFVAESARSKDPQIIFYPAPGSPPVPMVGAIMITTAKPASGNFSHLISDNDDEHITLVAGTFSM
ncbi:hypothetical protein ACFGVR_02360 [Mucilaginibacter sp. AW1-3]